MSKAIERFAEAAGHYCRWAEGEPTDSRSEARTARRLVAELYWLAVHLPDGPPGSDAPEITLEQRQMVLRRFGALPFQYYAECFNPLAIPPEEPVIADLADNFADIWCDLKRGLVLYERGAIDAAAWEWRLHFSIHWGHHATGALYALQKWFSQNDDDLE